MAIVIEGYRVAPSMDKGWNVERVNAKRATKRFEKYSDAIKYGVELSKRHATDLYIHDKNGWVQEKRSYRRSPQGT